MPAKMIYTTFKCAKCGATDVMKTFENELIPVTINCWSCHAGQGVIDVSRCIAQREGMFQVQPEAQMAGARG